MRKPNIELLNIDCLEYLKQCEDKQFDLAIVDPPYGIGAAKMQMGNNKNKKWIKKDWDNETPTDEYFTELIRVSKNQIVWGGNYFKLPNVKGWIVWDKNNGESDFADGELAWTSFDKPLKIKKIHWCGSASNWEDTNGKIHPTQKPVKLYEWILDKYAKPNFKIIDTHLGSGSIAVACWNRKYDLVGIEIDKEYYTKAVKRLEAHKKQLQLF